eukprot:gene7004-2439_t
MLPSSGTIKRWKQQCRVDPGTAHGLMALKPVNLTLTLEQVRWIPRSALVSRRSTRLERGHTEAATA